MTNAFSSEFTLISSTIPTADEQLKDKNWVGTKPKQSGDYPKKVAIFKESSYLDLEEIASPNAAIGLCHTAQGWVTVEKIGKGLALPGGTLGIGDNFEDALRREFLEEVGVELTDWKEWFYFKPNGRLDHTCKVFVCRGTVVQNQREEDRDHVISFLQFDDLVRWMADPRQIDTQLRCKGLLALYDKEAKKAFASMLCNFIDGTNE
jgi:8-oxo-dGTP pyrophosphatase MutT (NUDIX family)